MATTSLVSIANLDAHFSKYIPKGFNHWEKPPCGVCDECKLVRDETGKAEILPQIPNDVLLKRLS